MPSFKASRLSTDMRYALTTIFSELKDPRVSKMLSIVKLDLSSDLSHCKIYVSAIEGTDKTVESVKGLKSASGFIRKEISSRLKIRHSPELHFFADDGIAQSAKINDMLIQIEKDRKNEERD